MLDFLKAHSVGLFSTFGSIAFLWILGKVSGSLAYRGARTKFGAAMKTAGVWTDKIGGSRLGYKIWDPIEKMLTDFLGFGMEQYCVGLRENDVKALADQHERLRDAGSQMRLEAIEQKLQAALDKGVDPKMAEDPVFQAAVSHMEEAAKTGV